MENWKKLICEANSEHSAKNFAAAIALYEKSLGCALEISDQIENDPNGHIAAILVTYFNLSETFENMGNVKKAGTQFEHAFKSIIRFLRQGYSDQVNAAVIRAGRQLNLEWSSFIHKHSDELEDAHFKRYENFCQIFGGLSNSTSH